MDICIRKMTPADIGEGMRLKDAVGWNQTPCDWHGYLLLQPEGCFVAERDGRVVATTTTIDYLKRVGWIGMVIVDPLVRHQGVATQMVRRAVSYLESTQCACQKLDATDAGALVYQKFGFEAEYRVERWLCAPETRSTLRAPSATLTEFGSGHLSTITRFDAMSFGASRAGLLRWYCSNDGPRLMAGTMRCPSGYVLGRMGSRSWQMGPLVAKDSSTAKVLMNHFLSNLPAKQVIADVPAENIHAVPLLEDLGFVRQRVLQRMSRGEYPYPRKPHTIFCLAGFEFG